MIKFLQTCLNKKQPMKTNKLIKLYKILPFLKLIERMSFKNLSDRMFIKTIRSIGYIAFICKVL